MKNKPEIFNKASDGHIKTNGNEKKEEDKEDGYIVDKKGPSFTYNADKIIGNGTFGVVYLSTVAETGEKVAIKKVFQDKRYKNRELTIIKELNHPNIIKLRHAFYTTGENQDEVFLNIVMDYIPETLSKLLKVYRKNKQLLPNILVKLYSYQMFRAIAYLIGIGICHRDIKPQNMLIDPQTHLLKICDFGSAKRLIKGEPNVAYICSRYYRAPELIFGATDYSNEIDTWSTGCVVAELLLGEPVFPGESAVDQLVEIIKILGTPTYEQVKLMNPNYNEFRFPQIKAHHWTKVFKPKIDPLAIDLISKVLVYPPKERLRPLQALMHPYFNELRNENCRINNQSLPFPDLFNFTPEEISTNPDLAEKLIPSWYKANGNKML